MGGIERWWADGERVPLELSGAEREIFVRRLGLGSGPSMTLLHGFPSSSHNWAKVAPALAERHALLMPDLLGFGASDKPRDHAYSMSEQADMVEALWAREGVGSTVIVAHDYSLSVTQELLARHAEDSVDVEIVAAHLLNGGLYPDLHRPRPVQHILLDREQGPKVSAAMTEEAMTNALAPTFADAFDATSDSADMWTAIARDAGHEIIYLLTRYIEDRLANAERWVRAIETTDVPLAFVWGMLDPVSGAHMAERIAERLPRAPLLALADVAHWPQLEAPARVARALLGDWRPRRRAAG